MRVYLLMHSAMQNDSDYVIAAFSSREAAQATLDAMDAIPWSESSTDEFVEHRYRRMKIEGFGFDYSEWALRWLSEPMPDTWPPKARLRIEGHEMSERLLTVKVPGEPRAPAVSSKPRSEADGASGAGNSIAPVAPSSGGHSRAEASEGDGLPAPTGTDSTEGFIAPRQPCPHGSSACDPCQRVYEQERREGSAKREGGGE